MHLPFDRLEAVDVALCPAGQNSFGDEVKSVIRFSDTDLRYGCRSALGTGERVSRMAKELPHCAEALWFVGAQLG